jgi:hypothetical protein
MTDEEAEALDEYYTRNTIMPVRGKPGIFARCKAHMVAVDDVSSAYLTSKAQAERKTPSEIIGELVREKIASQAEAAAP